MAPVESGALNPAVVASWSAVSGGIWSGEATWPEVGIIQLRSGLQSGSYLNTGVVSGPWSNHVGRFVPQRLEVTASRPSFRNACVAGSFGYVGQPFALNALTGIEWQVRGLSRSGTITQSYDASFFRLNTSLSNRTWVSENAGQTLMVAQPGVITLEDVSAPINGRGVIRLDSSVRLNYVKGLIPVAPFDALVRFSSAPADWTDADGVCLDNDQNNICEGFHGVV